MKFKNIDSKYITARKELSAQYGNRELWSVIDHWPLYAGVANIGRYLAISDILRSTLDVPGHIVEFGSWRGANLLWMTKLLQIFDPHAWKEVHCFDSFEGLTEFVEKDGQKTQDEFTGTYKGSEQELRDMIDLYELNDAIQIHKGRIEDTLETFLQNHADFSCSLVYCDVDLYQATVLMLTQLHSRLSKGGVFVLDEWNHEKFPGETVAVREFLEQYGDYYNVEHVRHARQPTLVLRKIRY